MAMALEGSLVFPASAREVGDWVRVEAADSLAKRAQRAAEIESQSGGGGIASRAPERGHVGGGLREPEVSTSGSHVSEGDAALAREAQSRPHRDGLPVVGRCFRRVEPRDSNASHAIGGAVSATRIARGGNLERGSELPPPAPVAAPTSADGAPFASAPRPEPRRAPATRAPTRPSPRASPAASCDPPYTIDRDGTRRWKDGC